MRWASTMQVHVRTEDAVRAAAEALETALGGEAPDLVIAFVSAAHQGSFAAVPALLRQHFPGAAVIGSSASGVVGVRREIEDGPALSVMAARLPDVDITVAHVEAGEVPSDPAAWHALLELDPLTAPVILVIPEPHVTAGEALTVGLDEAYPHSVKIGGVTSGVEAGHHALFADGFVHRRGAIVAALTGDIAADTVVAQGARPVGPGLVVTGAQGNQVSTLDGQPATLALTAVYEMLDDDDRELFARRPMIGLREEGVEEYLVRPIVGVHRQDHTLAVGFPAEVGQQIRFHVRDPESATLELNGLLEQHRAAHGVAEAALMFTCVGRGERFFGEPDHDATLVAEHLGEVPLGGFFCSAELGPVRSRTHVHSHTTALALFRRAGWN